MKQTYQQVNRSTTVFFHVHSTLKNFCDTISAGTIRWPYADPMLVYRLRRWPNIGSTYGQPIVPAWILF